MRWRLQKAGIDYPRLHDAPDACRDLKRLRLCPGSLWDGRRSMRCYSLGRAISCPKAIWPCKDAGKNPVDLPERQSQNSLHQMAQDLVAMAIGLAARHLVFVTTGVQNNGKGFHDTQY